MILGFLTSVAYVPGWTGSVIQSNWIFLSVALPFLLWTRLRVTWPHVFFSAFMIYAFISLSWSFTPLWGVEYVWHLGLLYLCFLVGGVLVDLSGVIGGLSLGMAVSGAIALAQFSGWHGIPSFHDKPAGLLYNANILSQTAAIVLVASAIYCKPGLALLCVPAWIIGEARTAWLAGVVGLLCLYRAWFIVFALAGLIPLMMWIKTFHGFWDRWEIWTSLDWTFWGWGPPFHLIQPMELWHAFSDPLELLWVFGVGAGLLFATFIMVCQDKKSRPVLITFGLTSLASITFFTPVAGFVACLVAGHATRSLPVVVRHSYSRREALRAWAEVLRSIRTCLGKPDLSLQSHH